MGDLDAHIESNCATLTGETSVDQILSQPLSTPTTQKEKLLASNLVRRMLNESPDNVV